jgi:hypothetical protein
MPQFIGNLQTVSKKKHTKHNNKVEKKPPFEHLTPRFVFKIAASTLMDYGQEHRGNFSQFWGNLGINGLIGIT